MRAWASWILLLLLLWRLLPPLTFPSSQNVFRSAFFWNKLATTEKAFISAKEPALVSSRSVSLERLFGQPESVADSMEISS